MAGHVQDLWLKRGPDGKKNVRSARYGKGKRWQARWSDGMGGEPTKLFANQDAALAYVAKMNVDVDDGTYIDPKSGLVLFREYATGWQGDQRHYRQQTKNTVRSLIENHAYPVIGDHPMRVIRRQNIQKVINTAGDVVGPGTVELLYAKLKSIFASAVLDKVIRETPCLKIMLPENVRSRTLILTSEQVLEIQGRVPDIYKAPMTVVAATGVRKGELFGWTVDRMRGPRDDLTMIVDRQMGDKAHTWKPTKTASSDREVRLGRTASLCVSDHLDIYGPSNDGHIFRTTIGTEIRPTTQQNIWNIGKGSMDLGPRSGWHLLRHYNAAVLIRGGISVAALADHLGHANTQTTYNFYVHIWPDDSDRIVSTIDLHFSELLVAA